MKNKQINILNTNQFDQKIDSSLKRKKSFIFETARGIKRIKRIFVQANAVHKKEQQLITIEDRINYKLYLSYIQFILLVQKHQKKINFQLFEKYLFFYYQPHIQINLSQHVLIILFLPNLAICNTKFQ
ncbi:hypothetical protein TTHERM_001055501 (macronuclear) [Tetrahymena thermophila SB210]|uniref:Uncharacterized protein n=1 Tax=Tetrahymena thermophila (strain SB210) TaxID=312017 RepID=W7WZM4_TETTS|nr:hypothetical protein TTHERM_001055501 [Tetrahymena thermophila SB210]EWS71047.1 hypothetical protein TTHERM_001055501 [Tetrahymena thermophila SB210]|eukprot:XP_012656413.1 hypothetical protein TTHERM_001055501 [Tetrahymena thermophila SB210]